MSNTKMRRNIFLATVALYLTSAIFTGCGSTTTYLALENRTGKDLRIGFRLAGDEQPVQVDEGYLMYDRDVLTGEFPQGPFAATVFDDSGRRDYYFDVSQTERILCVMEQDGGISVSGFKPNDGSSGKTSASGSDIIRIEELK